MSKGLPVTVLLRRLSPQHNIQAVMFQLLGDFWQLEGASTQSKHIVIARCHDFILKKMRAHPESITPMASNKYGVDTHGFACPIKQVFSKANLMRYIRQDPCRHLLGLRRKLNIAVLTSGRIMAVAGTKEASIYFDEQKKIPIWISRAAIVRRRRKVSLYEGKEILLDVYGRLLRRLDDVVERVMQDTTVFVDPLEMKHQGNRQCISLRWDK